MAIEKNLYNGIEKEEIVSWEDFYTTEMDNKYPELIKELISYTKNPVIKKVLLMNNIKERLARIIVIQMLRTPERIFSQNENYISILESLENELKNEDQVFQKEEKIKLLNKYKQEKYYKGMVLKEINDKSLLEKFTRVILNRTWLLYYNNTELDFITSDNPVILYNHVNKTIGMVNGIGRDDTVISIPITPKYYILMLPNMYLFGKLKEKFDNELILIKEENVIEILNKQQSENCKRQIYSNNIKLLQKYI